MSKIKKTETLEQYLARGGVIQIIPQHEKEKQQDVIRKTVAGEPAVILSLEDASLFYGESSKTKKAKKKKSTPTIDINALPEALRIKVLAKLKQDGYGEDVEEGFEEDYEEDLEEDEED